MAIKRRFVKSELRIAMEETWNKGDCTSSYAAPCKWVYEEGKLDLYREKDPIMSIIDDAYYLCDEDGHDKADCVGCKARAIHHRLTHPKIVKDDLRLPLGTRLLRSRR